MTDNPGPPIVVEYKLSWPEEGTGRIGTFTIARAEWNRMTPAQRTARIEQELDDIAAGEMGWGWHIPDEDDWAATERDA